MKKIALPVILLLAISAPLTTAWSAEDILDLDEVTVNDPLEGYNRAMFGFNEALDENILKPVAEGYHDLFPDPVERGISNFFSNLHEPFNILNNLLQFKLGDAASDTVRFGINTTIGIAGLFDVATAAGLTKHDEDLGQTLAVWGVGSGPYFVIPILGPSTIRDAFGTGTEMWIGNTVEVDDTQIFKLTDEIDSEGTRNTLFVTKAISTRADLLGTKEIIDDASFDPYAFMRDSYLQKREDLIFDGNAPLPELPEDF
ncbi:MAG: VacJ family lipoprotein [Gammaproteobacteria bacterium]|nr:VacJ family lipoprotein [Gammaproteobacteria bacterium]